MKPFGMELESKNSVSGVRKVIVLFGIIFCTIVTLLLIVLYYPSNSEEKEFDDDFKKMVSVGITNEDASKTRVEDVARALEDFGAAFLALVAVCCVAVGLTCLFCACCILK